MKKKFIIVAGARPNFMKIAPLMKELKKYPSIKPVLVHTGQHYDFLMSDVFFKDLGISQADIYLNVGSASHAMQSAKIMMAFEEVLLKEKPDLVIVVGDVNSTLACSLVASKMNIKVAHVEAGLRSFDRTMPEEINRVVTDSISDYLFVSEKSGLINLKNEGVKKRKVFFTGNIMIDALLSNMKKINASSVLKNFSLQPGSYVVLTLHRPSNVDSRQALAEIYDIIGSVSQKIKIVYPIHVRTKEKMKLFHMMDTFNNLTNLTMIEPLGYVDFVKLVKDSKLVITDSGGIQEETTVLGIPCLTMRDNTERPVTIQEGTNILVGRNKRKIISSVNKILRGEKERKKNKIPQFWDGKAAQRIVKVLSAI
ncbi:MAG: UDP-N-acetylglucosamine 2-epimerase (non-hydrolyzing) [Candidatus Jettenia sp.]|nr:UDP-N-acetylglucosamine 2-epimerase (non-hydrolyzing) [Candidatus Jettenia sp.]